MKVTGILTGGPKRRLKYLRGRLLGKEFAHFIHVGKTGGSAIKHALRQCSRKRSPYEIFLHSHRVTLMEIPRGEKVFFFVRDPIGRFVSGFYSRQRRGLPRYLTPWSREEEEAFRRFSTPGELARALSSPNADDKESARKAMQSIEHVKDSFWKWFGNEAYFTSRLTDVLFIGSQERLAEDFAALKSLLGLPDEAALPEDDVNAHRNPAGLDKELQMDSLSALRVWFRAEYEFIDLCRRHMSAGADCA